MKYNPIEIYAIVCLCTIILTVGVGWLVLYIRDRILSRRIVEAERAKYIAQLKKERNFYRIQCQTRNILDEYEKNVAFEQMLQEAVE